MNTKIINFYINSFEQYKQSGKPVLQYVERLNTLFVEGEIPEKEYKILKEIITDELPISATQKVKKLPVIDPCTRQTFGRGSPC